MISIDVAPERSILLSSHLQQLLKLIVVLIQVLPKMIKCLPNKLRLKKIILLFLTHGLGGGLLRRTSQCRRLCRSLRLGS